MGEDSCKIQPSVEKKTSSHAEMSGQRNGDHSFPDSSTMSTCSDVDSEYTSYIDEENDQDYQYGPGIVSKLRTKFLSITLKQNRGANGNMRRSCSLENLLDPKPSERTSSIFVPQNRLNGSNCNGCISAVPPWNNLKRAKSMDTLLASLESSSGDIPNPTDISVVDSCKKFKEPKVIRRRDGPLNRTTVTITDEEFPKPDTVKTYKRMFEPADSKKASSNSNVRRRPPVLRASAKSGSNSNLKTGSLPNSHNKMNGSIQPPRVAPANTNRFSAKDVLSHHAPKVVNIENKHKTISTPVENKLKASSTLADNKLKASNTPADNKLKAVSTLADNKLKASSTLVDNKLKAVSTPSENKRNVIPNPVDNKHKVMNTLVENKLKLLSIALENKTVEKELIIIKKQEVHQPKKDLPCNGIPKTDSIKLKVKDEITKRNFRSTLKPSEANSAKPIVPLKKPHLFKKPQVASTKTNDSTQATKDSPPVKVPKKSPNFNKSSVRSPEPIHENGLQCKTDNSESITNGFDKPETGRVQKVSEPVPDTSKRTSSSDANSMVFDFRGKDVVSHLSISPAPFGCKSVIRKRNVFIDGKESVPHLNGLINGDVDSEDEDYVDYSVPPPCGLVFEGENVRVGKGSILITRNKDLKIQFDEDIEKNTFIYPSESSFCVEDSSLSSSELSSLDSETPEPMRMVNGGDSTKLPSNTAINSSGSGGLMSYTPSVLRTVDNFQLGLFRAQEDKKKKPEEEKEGEEENQEQNTTPEGEVADDMLKPADPEYISSWSLSAGTSDLLF